MERHNKCFLTFYLFQISKFNLFGSLNLIWNKGGWYNMGIKVDLEWLGHVQWKPGIFQLHNWDSSEQWDAAAEQWPLSTF